MSGRGSKASCHHRRCPCHVFTQNTWGFRSSALGVWKEDQIYVVVSLCRPPGLESASMVAPSSSAPCSAARLPASHLGPAPAPSASGRFRDSLTQFLELFGAEQVFQARLGAGPTPATGQASSRSFASRGRFQDPDRQSCPLKGGYSFGCCFGYLNILVKSL